MLKMDDVDCVVVVVVYFILRRLLYLAFSATLGVSANDDGCDGYDC